VLVTISMVKNIRLTGYFGMHHLAPHRVTNAVKLKRTYSLQNPRREQQCGGGAMPKMRRAFDAPENLAALWRGTSPKHPGSAPGR
jgi:hypothetical protein